MSIQVTCLGCEKTFRVKDRYAGKIGSCPFCSGTVRVPKVETASEEFDALAEDGVSTGGSSAGQSLLNTVQIVSCQQCGRRNLGGMPFCVNCGGRLEG